MKEGYELKNCRFTYRHIDLNNLEKGFECRLMDIVISHAAYRLDYTIVRRNPEKCAQLVGNVGRLEYHTVFRDPKIR